MISSMLAVGTLTCGPRYQSNNVFMKASLQSIRQAIRHGPRAPCYANRNPNQQAFESSSPYHSRMHLHGHAERSHACRTQTGVQQSQREHTWTRQRPSACSKGDAMLGLAPCPLPICMSASSAADLGSAATEGMTYSPCTSYLHTSRLLRCLLLPTQPKRTHCSRSCCCACFG